jgi:hypothetical protein
MPSAERRGQALVHHRNRLLVLVAGDDGCERAPLARRVLLGGHGDIGVAQRADPAGGGAQSVGNEILVVQPSRRWVLAGSAYQSARSHARPSMLPKRFLLNAELLAHERCKLGDGGPCAGADVEVLTVEAGVHHGCGQDEGGAGVVDVHEVARRAGIDERREVPLLGEPDDVRDQAGGVLERPVDRIQPQVDARECLLLADPLQVLGRRHLGHRVVAIGLARAVLAGSGAVQAVLRRGPGMHEGCDAPLQQQLDQVHHRIEVGAIDQVCLVLERIGPVRHAIEDRLRTDGLDQVLGRGMVVQVAGDDLFVLDVAQPPALLVANHGIDVVAEPAQVPEQVGADEARGAKHQDRAAQGG